MNCGEDSDEVCRNATITCAEGVDCTVLCWGLGSCHGATINANGASSLHVAVLGGGEELQCHDQMRRQLNVLCVVRSDYIAYIVSFML